MVVITEVHPFADGNGRVARVMMNAELSAVEAARIVIPSVYRNEYIAGLRSTSASEGTEVSVLMRVMGFAWRWTAAMPWEDRGRHRRPTGGHQRPARPRRRRHRRDQTHPALRA